MTGHVVPGGMDCWSAEVGEPSEQSCVGRPGSIDAGPDCRYSDGDKASPQAVSRSPHTHQANSHLAVRRPGFAASRSSDWGLNTLAPDDRTSLDVYDRAMVDSESPLQAQRHDRRAGVRA